MFQTYLVTVFCDKSCIICLVHCGGVLIKEGMCFVVLYCVVVWCGVNNSSSSGNCVTVVDILYLWLVI